jgi:dihydroorotate dehydrogenase (fumarate)
MKNIKTKYLGLELQSPLIISSSGLSKKIENLKIAEENGVGAIVLKSLFEEQISFESNKAISQNLIDFPEANDYIRNYSKHNSLSEYCAYIKQAKKTVGIPIIASINCSNVIEWGEFAKEIEKSGADAIELNMNVFSFDPDLPPNDIEKTYYDIIEEVKNFTTLPVACKIGRNFTSIPYIIKQMNLRGINSFVLFNKFFEPIIDTQKEEIRSSSIFSNEHDIKHSLRWIAVVNGVLPDVEISASTGVHSADGVIQELLAGATTVQLCSVLYKKGMYEIGNIRNDLIKWMNEKSYNSLADFKGKLSYSNIKEPKAYERFQFIKHFTSVE